VTDDGRMKKTSENPVSEVVLKFVEGENEGVELRVSPPRELTMGRSEECDIFLGEKKISRKHCRLFVQTEGVRLQDLQSTNGTFLNKKKISQERLRHEDKIQVGTTVIQIFFQTQSQAASRGEMSSEAPTRPTVEPVVAKPVEPKLPKLPKPLFPAEETDDSPSGVMDVGGQFHREPPQTTPLPEGSSKEFFESGFERKPKPLAGNLSAMGLADLLQNLAQNRKSGVLKVKSVREGKITVVEGKVLAAETGAAHGVKALHRMLGWNEGEFELHPLANDFKPDQIENVITDSTESLLMEGFRQFDELEKLRKELPAISARFTLKPGLASPLSKLHPRVLDVVQLILNDGKFEHILDKSALSDLETSKIIFYLLKKDYIVAS
jgi:pSer/pThr/pTyr-binding forkhead associated (FHA) protein